MAEITGSEKRSKHLSCAHEPTAYFAVSPQQLWCLGPGQYVLVHCHAACRIILTSKWFSAAPCSQPPLSVYSHSPPYMLPGAIHGVSGIFTVRREPYRPTVYLRDPATRGCPAEKGITSPARVLFSLRLSTRCQRTAQHMPNGGRKPVHTSHALPVACSYVPWCGWLPLCAVSVVERSCNRLITHILHA